MSTEQFLIQRWKGKDLNVTGVGVKKASVFFKMKDEMLIQKYRNSTSLIRFIFIGDYLPYIL